MDYPFTTDGCSGGMTALWRLVFRRDPPWNDLCVQHDQAYWAGGTRADRFIADCDLMCGVMMRGHMTIAVLMFLAVRLGGHPLLPLPWRWGYGFKFPHPYDPESSQ